MVIMMFHNCLKNFPPYKVAALHTLEIKTPYVLSNHHSFP